jgi:micrococcal nuclease
MYEYKVEIDRVLDGDTVDVNINLGFGIILSKKRVRLYGIDAPESRTRDKEEKVRGLLSKSFLKVRCPVGSSVILISHDIGKFGRILGELFEYNKREDNISINQLMCDQGFAVPYFGGNKDSLEELHLVNKQVLIKKGLL